MDFLVASQIVKVQLLSLSRFIWCVTLDVGRQKSGLLYSMCYSETEGKIIIFSICLLFPYELS